MSEITKSEITNDTSLKNAFLQGRNTGFAIAAITMSLVAFLSLLGMEKAIVAIVLGIITLKNVPKGQVAYNLGKTAVIIGILHILTVVIVVIVFWQQIEEVIELLEQLS